MWYLDSHILGNSGMGRVQRELLGIRSVFDRYIGDCEKIKKYTNGKSLYQMYHFKEYDDRGNINVFHFPYNEIPDCCMAGVAIVTINDIIPLYYPTKHTDELEEYKKSMNWTVHRADYILTISEASKRDIMDYFNIEESKITVIHCPVNDFFCKLSDDIIYCFTESREGVKNRKRILTMANRFQYKNLTKTLEAFAELEAENTVLVVVGNLKELREEYLDYAKELGVYKRVIFTGDISDEELRLWYNAADIFVFPSLMEGFGLPPLEAMACGTPVITSNISSLPEVVGNAALTVNPHKKGEIAEAIQYLLKDAEACNQLVTAGYERVKLFSAQQYRENIKKYYEKIAADIQNHRIIPRDYSRYVIRKGLKEVNLFKMNMLFDIVVYWMGLKNRNINISAFFSDRNYKRIAIYGMGKLAKLLLDELSDSEVEVLYGIDQSIQGTIHKIAVHSPDKIGVLEAVDAYVVTTPYIFNDIENLILEHLETKRSVLGIDEIIFDF